MYTLQHSNKDCGIIFQRRNWTDIYFRWHTVEKRYIYCDKTGKFAPAYHSQNKGKLSRVGEGVLERDDIIQYKDKKDKIMNKNVNYVGGEYYGVGVIMGLAGDQSESNQKEYIFKVDINLHLAEGDSVVVESQNGYGLGVVTKTYQNTILNANVISRAKAWVVDKVNMFKHMQKKTATERRKYLIEQLDERKARVEETAIYELVAKTDETAAAMLEELKQLS